MAVASLGALLLAGATVSLAGARARPPSIGPAEPSPALVGLAASVIAAPTAVLATDKRRHLVYEISLLNVTGAAERVDRVEVLDAADRSVITSYDGDRAVRAIMSSAVTTLQQTPTDELPPGGGAVLWLDVSFPQGAHPPRHLVHRIVFTELSSPQRQGIVNGARTRVNSRAPVVLGPPLLGAGYVDGNGCCGESAHTRALLTIDGQRYLAQRYAIDWNRLDRHGRSFVGDPTKNEDYLIFGDPVIAVASGVVIATRNDLPENTPPHSIPNLTVQNAFGNDVIEALGAGRYAGYGHLQPGSVAVHVGERVHRGQLLGRVGNTGSSGGPHLHFQLTDGSNVLASNGEPYVFSHFELTGEAVGFDNATGQVKIRPADEPLVRHDQLPLEGTETTFTQ
ncbi:MAG: M23 family metallopeptidase [Solirubrobacterales bacterium]|nr:M23 family metallopeptidase [Solirubrobacterales bacterium]